MNKEEIKKDLKENQSMPFPTEIIDLPSKGLVYPDDNPLSSGKLTLRYPTAKEEDILTSQNLIKKGTVIDELIKAILVTPINYNNLILGDKNAIIFATRILAYGTKYNIEVKCPICDEKSETEIDLSNVENKEIDFSILNRNNVYEYELPFSKRKITFKLLTYKDEKEIQRLIKQKKEYYKKIKNKTLVDNELSIRLKQMLISIEGETDKKIINKFVDSEFLTRDSQAFRKHASIITPDVDINYDYECNICGETSKIKIPITTEFFWPNATA